MRDDAQEYVGTRSWHRLGCGCDDCFAARKAAAYDRLVDPTPLDLAVLTAELGEPAQYGQHGSLWQQSGFFIASSDTWGTVVANGDPESPNAGELCMSMVATLGQLRRILSVIREQEQAK